MKLRTCYAVKSIYASICLWDKWIAFNDMLCLKSTQSENKAEMTYCALLFAWICFLALLCHMSANNWRIVWYISEQFTQLIVHACTLGGINPGRVEPASPCLGWRHSRLDGPVRDHARLSPALSPRGPEKDSRSASIVIVDVSRSLMRPWWFNHIDEWCFMEIGNSRSPAPSPLRIFSQSCPVWERRRVRSSHLPS